MEISQRKTSSIDPVFVISDFALVVAGALVFASLDASPVARVGDKLEVTTTPERTLVRSGNATGDEGRYYEAWRFQDPSHNVWTIPIASASKLSLGDSVKIVNLGDPNFGEITHAAVMERR